VPINKKVIMVQTGLKIRHDTKNSIMALQSGVTLKILTWSKTTMISQFRVINTSGSSSIHISTASVLQDYIKTDRKRCSKQATDSCVNTGMKCAINDIDTEHDDDISCTPPSCKKVNAELCDLAITSVYVPSRRGFSQSLV